MERQVANVRVREVGTLGGNLCFADPRSDPGVLLLALDAEIEQRRGGVPGRRIPIADFVLGPYQTSLAAGEVLTSVRVPELPQGARVRYEKFAFHERPTATVACLVHVAEDTVAAARIAVGSVGPRPVRAVEAEQQLVGVRARDIGPELLAEAGARAAATAAPIDDATGSAEYKAQLVRVLVARAVGQALA